MIYKNIHQIWGGKPMPDYYGPWIQSWKDHHNDWVYRLWTEEECRCLIKDKHSWFLETYDRYPYDINRYDAARYFILYEIGGLYCDTDILCFKNVSPLIDDQYECTLFPENPDTHLKGRLPGCKQVLTNSIYYAAPNSRYIFRSIKRLQSALRECEGLLFQGVHPGHVVMLMTSPEFMTITYEQCGKITSNTVKSHVHFERLSKAERKNVLLNNMEYEVTDDMYGMHWNIGEWIENKNDDFKVIL